MTQVLERSGLVITRAATGIIEHPVFVRNPDGTSTVLCHLEVLPSGHATVVDYDAHPNYENPHPTPAHHAAAVKKFLELGDNGAGGHTMLGHPNAPTSGAAEVARLKTKHSIA